MKILLRLLYTRHKSHAWRELLVQLTPAKYPERCGDFLLEELAQAAVFRIDPAQKLAFVEA